jgi:hypothetical protein
MKADSCGHLSLIPGLNAAEFEYLSAFVLSRRHAGRSSPYDVPDNPHEDSVVRVGPPPAPGLPPTIPEPEWDRELYNEPIEGQPSLWCPWEPSCHGECLSLDTKEKIYAPVQWLQYILDHFLVPTAHSRASDRPEFADFTFDHLVTGAVALHSMESGELGLLRVVNDVVEIEVITPGDYLSMWA